MFIKFSYDFYAMFSTIVYLAIEIISGLITPEIIEHVMGFSIFFKNSRKSFKLLGHIPDS